MSSKSVEDRSGMVVVPTRWDDVFILCRKCRKRTATGFGPDGDLPLRKALRQELKARGRRGRVGVIEAGCFGVCPRHGVTLMRASRPGELLVVTPATFGHLFMA